MNKCINCAYFLNCENANKQNACNKYNFIRKNINYIKPEVKDEKIKKRNIMFKMFGM